MARSTLEDFVLKEKLGSGSYGAVYRAVRKVDRCERNHGAKWNTRSVFCACAAQAAVLSIWRHDKAVYVHERATGSVYAAFDPVAVLMAPADSSMPLKKWTCRA